MLRIQNIVVKTYNIEKFIRAKGQEQRTVTTDKDKG
jgi:hypothetical protein